MSVLDRFPHSTAELKRVKTVQFGVLSPDEIVSVFFLFTLSTTRAARDAKSRCVCVCVRVIAADKISPSFLSFTFSLLVRCEEAGKTRER